MYSAIKSQCVIMFHKASFKIVFSTLLFYNLLSYFRSIFDNKQTDVVEMLTRSFIFSGNAYAPFWNLFETLFPFLVVFPFAFSYIDDSNTGIYNYTINRMNKGRYYTSKLTACFFGGFVMIGIPFMINLLLCTITFRENQNIPTGLYNLASYYESLTGMNILTNTNHKVLPMLKIFLLNPSLYSVIFISMLSLFSGMLSMFSGACSFFLKRHKIILFIPVYMLFFISDMIDIWVSSKNNQMAYMNFRWISYVHINLDRGRNYSALFALLAAILIFCMFSVHYHKRKDML